MNLKVRALLFRTILTLTAILAAGTGTLLWDGLHDDVARADIGLVLGNTVFPDGTPSPRLAARLDRAAALYHEGQFGLMMVSGAPGKEGHDEAIVMRGYLIIRGVPSERILVDSEGYTTFHSANNTAKLMRRRGFDSVLIISQYFHLPRARLAMQRFGFARIYTAHAHYFEWRDLYSIAREIPGFLQYLCRSYDA